MATSQFEQDQEAFTPVAKPVIGVLLVHGLNGSKNDFAEMETLLRSHGMVVVNTLLPGHGAHVKDLLAMGWEDWARAVREELQALKQQCDVVFLVGHSLGGALSLHVRGYREYLRSPTHVSLVKGRRWHRQVHYAVAADNARRCTRPAGAPTLFT